MHGRKKPTEGPTAEELAEEAKKVAKYATLADAYLVVLKARSLSPAAFQLNSKMVGANPDYYSAWNHRREMLQGMEGDGALDSIAQGELQLTKMCIAKRNPKSYCAWFHRQWVVDRYQKQCDLEAELQLCEKLLMHDERNFHCWNYRRWVAALLGVPLQSELDFAKKKIMYNFSNYSAWHYRSKLLPQLAPLTADVLTGELDFLQDALFTEPADQSLWMYHRWLLSELAKAHVANPDTRDAVREAMATQLEQCAELAEAMEQDGESSKWPRLAQAYLLRLMASTDSGRGFDGDDAGVGAGAGAGAGAATATGGGSHSEAAELFAKIADMDPHHAHFYSYASHARSPMLGDLSAPAPVPSEPA